MQKPDSSHTDFLQRHSGLSNDKTGQTEIANKIPKKKICWGPKC